MDVTTERGMQEAIDWTEEMFASMNDGAVWLIPRTMTLCKINKKRRHVQLSSQKEKSLTAVLTQMGWTYSYDLTIGEPK